MRKGQYICCFNQKLSRRC